MWFTLIVINMFVSLFMYISDLVTSPYKLLLLNPIPVNYYVVLFYRNVKITLLFGLGQMIINFIVYAFNFLILSSQESPYEMIIFNILISLSDIIRYILVKYNINPVFNLLLITSVYLINIIIKIFEEDYKTLSLLLLGLLFYGYLLGFFLSICINQNNLRLNFPINRRYIPQEDITEMVFIDRNHIHENTDIHIDINDILPDSDVSSYKIKLGQPLPENFSNSIKQILDNDENNNKKIYQYISPINHSEVEEHKEEKNKEEVEEHKEEDNRYTITEEKLKELDKDNEQVDESDSDDSESSYEII
jgi:hypothetical protein